MPSPTHKNKNIQFSSPSHTADKKENDKRSTEPIVYHSVSMQPINTKNCIDSYLNQRTQFDHQRETKFVGVHKILEVIDEIDIVQLDINDKLNKIKKSLAKLI